jgi:hypothetical protein
MAGRVELQPGRNRWIFSLVILFLLSVISLAWFLFTPGWNRNAEGQVIQVSLHSLLTANYNVDPFSLSVPEYGLALVEDALRDQNSTDDLPARMATLQGSHADPGWERACPD